MKKIKKIGPLIVAFMLNFYNTCFADLVWRDPETGEWVGGSAPRPTAPETKQVNYVLIGIIVLIVVVCAVFIIRRIIKKKKEKENDINK